MFPADALAGPPGIRIRLLGEFRVSVGGYDINDAAWRWRKARALVKLLALTPGHRLHREQILNALWPDQSPDGAANNLHQALYLARRAFEAVLPGDRPEAWIRVQAESVILTPPGPLEVDVDDFEAAAARAMASDDALVLLRAADLYSGELLPDDRYEDWTMSRRDALHRLHVSLLLEAARQDEAAGLHVRAVSTLARVLTVDAAHEDAHVALMRLYAIAGRRHAALEQYRQLEAALRRDLDAEPAPASTALHEDIAAERFPPPRPARGLVVLPEGNLPAVASSFIGRERELDELRRLIGATRLLTIVGPGGAGKTRLGLQLAESVRGEFPNGVWWVDLASLNDPQLLASGIMAAFGLQDDGRRNPQQIVTDCLRAKKLLLILDNCEHLVGACATLVGALLPLCPEVKVLVTSREALDTSGEVRWQTPPMTLPAAGVSSVEQVAASEAVGLFVARAQAVHPAFAVHENNARDVADICRKLDGMPLAVELAAARVRHLPPAEISLRLATHLDLLAGPHTAPPRHRTLRAALDWSYRLLGAAEQVLLNRLSVFGGSLSLEAAEGICGTERLEPTQVLDVLSHLIDKSLVQVEETPQGSLRYRLLETVRQYARDRLVESRGETAVRARHLHWFLDLAEAHDTDRGVPGEVEWLDLLEREHDNLRAALGWARENDPEMGVRLAGALGWFWMIRGYRSEGLRWLEEMLARSSARSAHRAKALYWVVILAVQMPPSVVEELAALSRTLPDSIHEARAKWHQGNLAWEQGDPARAAQSYADSVALFRQLGDGQGRRGLALALKDLGKVASSEGDHGRAAALLEESLALFRRSGDTLFIANALVHLSRAAQLQDRYQLARAYLEESLVTDRRIGARRRIANNLLRLADIARMQGAYTEATAMCDEGLAILRYIGDRALMAVALWRLATIAREQGEYARAKSLVEEGLAIGQVEDDRMTVNARDELGIIAFHEGDDARASALLEESLAYCRQTRRPRWIARTLNRLALLALRQGNIPRAAALARESLAEFRRLGAPAGMCYGLEAMAAVDSARGQPERAARLLGAAAGIRQAIGHAVPPCWRPAYEALTASVRSAAGEQAAEEAWRAGLGMNADAAAEYALAYSAHSQ